MTTIDASVRPIQSVDARTMKSAEEVLEGKAKRGLLAKLLPFLGPAFIAAIAYVDPGNFATNIESGAKYGYRLLWVIVASNLMALLIQSLSAKLGIVTGMSLAAQCKANFGKPVVLLMWIVMELVAVATDLAEFLGAALGFSLLLGLPLPAGAALAVVATLGLVCIERYGFRPLEMVIGILLAVVAGSYVIETLLDNPQWTALARNAIIPGFSDTESILLAAGILGATVMPHAIFLHSGLTQGRIKTRDIGQMRQLYRYELIDCGIAMGVAGFVNAAMLIMSASTFNRAGMAHIGTIEQAHKTLTPLLGHASSWVFAISLLASGLSSTAVGTMSGQLAMQGFTGKSIPIWLRRLLTYIPTLAVILVGFDPTRVLIISQVVLSFALPWALIPLLKFTSSTKIMGPMVNSKPVTAAAFGVTMVIVILNIYLIYRIFLHL